MHNKYSVIVFDLGNVLLPFEYTGLINKLEEVEKNLGNNLWKYYNDNYSIHRSFERGDLSEDEFIEKMMAVLDHKIDKETFFDYYSKIFTTNDDVIKLLPVLKKKYQLVLLSNTNSIHRKYGWQEYSFLDIFDKLILSYEVNYLKPEIEIFRAVENFTKKPSSEHIFIDDIKEYAEAAKKAGWDAIHFTGISDLIDNFKKREIL